MSELQGEAVVHWNSVVMAIFSANITYNARLLLSRWKERHRPRPRQVLIKKPGEKQREHSLHSSENLIHRKHSFVCEAFGLHPGSLGRMRSILLSTVGSIHTILAAIMTSVTKQDKRHLVPLS